MADTVHPSALCTQALLPFLGRRSAMTVMDHAGVGDDGLEATLARVGPRLRQLRDQRAITLAELAVKTGISKSTLSRLESGQRRPSLELLLPLTKTYGVPLDDLVGAPAVGDPRVRLKPHARHGRTVVPLSRQPGGVQAWKLVIPATGTVPELKTHEGYEWLYVLSGRMRVLIGEHAVVLGPGEVAEFDTRVPHWFGSAGEGPVEALSVFGPQGERMRHRASPKRALGKHQQPSA
jgi:transcriptional regulator with XRE-family HTH domain